uniref:Uncharacterized protein n=1 Tax=Romanomermis culicivorax TaxID=13658 RepID=A0A915IM59_ROMCU
MDKDLKIKEEHIHSRVENDSTKRENFNGIKKSLIRLRRKSKSNINKIECDLDGKCRSGFILSPFYT